MASSKKSSLIVNVLYWVVAALLHPLSRLLPTDSGAPKIYELLIPLIFIGLAFGSTILLSGALRQKKEP